MRNNKGITLIELLIVLAIMGIVITIVFSLLSFGIKSFSKQNVENETLSSSRYALDFITRDIRKANVVEVTSSSVLTIDGTEIKIIGNKLMKGSRVVTKGIESISFEKNGDKFTITVNGKYSSDVYIREGENYET